MCPRVEISRSEKKNEGRDEEKEKVIVVKRIYSRDSSSALMVCFYVHRSIISRGDSDERSKTKSESI